MSLSASLVNKKGDYMYTCRVRLAGDAMLFIPASLHVSIFSQVVCSTTASSLATALVGKTAIRWGGKFHIPYFIYIWGFCVSTGHPGDSFWVTHSYFQTVLGVTLPLHVLVSLVIMSPKLRPKSQTQLLTVWSMSPHVGVVLTRVFIFGVK